MSLCFQEEPTKKKLASTASKKAAVSCSQSAASKVECEAGGNNNRFPITMSLILGKKEEKHNLTTILKEVLAAVTEPALFFFLPGTSKIIWFQSSSLLQICTVLRREVIFFTLIFWMDQPNDFSRWLSCLGNEKTFRNDNIRMVNLGREMTMPSGWLYCAKFSWLLLWCDFLGNVFVCIFFRLKIEFGLLWIFKPSQEEYFL